MPPYASLSKCLDLGSGTKGGVCPTPQAVLVELVINIDVCIHDQDEILLLFRILYCTGQLMSE